jgi:hypothetical protein
MEKFLEQDSSASYNQFLNINDSTSQWQDSSTMKSMDLKDVAIKDCMY